jgi:copper oxidase (laccase) domain-containing protein
MPLRWSLAGDVQVAMSLREDGDLREDGRRIAWCSLHGFPIPVVNRQVHGKRVVAASVGLTAEADGLTAPNNEAIGVFGCDCPPLVVATPQAYGVAHCGWRGTAAGMVGELVAALDPSGSAARDTWSALVGPGIHPDDFEVDAPVLGARGWPAGTVLPGRPGHAWLDLPAAIAADCRSAGLGRVARSPLATSRHPQLRSHRRDGSGHPHLFLAWRKPCAG